MSTKVLLEMWVLAGAGLLNVLGKTFDGIIIFSNINIKVLKFIDNI